MPRISALSDRGTLLDGDYLAIAVAGDDTYKATLLELGVFFKIVPDQSGNSGKYLTTDGSNLSWDLIDESNINLTDITTNDSTTSKHGFLPKLSGASNQFLNGEGNFTTPAASAPNGYVAQAFTSQTSVNVAHNFGAYPIVQLINGSLAQFEPYSVTHNSLNDFTVTFTSSSSGTILASVGAPQFAQVVTVNNDYSITTDDELVTVEAFGKTMTLPTAVGVTGKKYHIDNASTADIFVDTTSSQTINDLTLQTIPPNSSMTVISNGSNWRII